MPSLTATPKQTINTNELKRTPIPVPIQPPQLDLETTQTVPLTPKVSLGREIQNITENKTILNKRISKQPTKMNLTTEAEIIEPETYQQAIHSPQAHKWINAMTEELEALAKNKTWTMVTRPNDGSNVVKSKWTYKLKKNAFGAITRYKARLVAVGTSQLKGLDFNQTFSPVVKWETIRILLWHAINKNLSIKQIDVSNAYLYGAIDKTIYLEQPPGFIEDPNKVCQLNKALYGLRQSGRIWHKLLTDIIVQCGYRLSKADQCLFLAEQDKYVLIYVDDIY